MSARSPLVWVLCIVAWIVPAYCGEDPDAPIANPARPTVATPATLTPVGYFQFETGFLEANNSPGLSSQQSFNEVIKISVTKWLQILAGSQPFAHSQPDGPKSNDAGDVLVGAQGVVYHGEGTHPTIALSYFHRFYSGSAADLDVGGPQNSFLALASADVKGFHYDANAMLNEVERRKHPPCSVWAEPIDFASSEQKVRYCRRVVAFHPAVPEWECGRKSLGLKLYGSR